MVNRAELVAGSAQVPSNVMVTSPPDSELGVFDVAQSPLKPLRTVTTGVLDANPKPLGKVTSIVSFDASERPPEADAVKPTVQVVPVAPATIDEPEKVTPDTAVGAAVIVNDELVVEAVSSEVTTVPV